MKERAIADKSDVVSECLSLFILIGTDSNCGEYVFFLFVHESFLFKKKMAITPSGGGFCRVFPIDVDNGGRLETPLGQSTTYAGCDDPYH